MPHFQSQLSWQESLQTESLRLWTLQNVPCFFLQPSFSMSQNVRKSLSFVTNWYCSSLILQSSDWNDSCRVVPSKLFWQVVTRFIRKIYPASTLPWTFWNSKTFTFIFYFITKTVHASFTRSKMRATQYRRAGSLQTHKTFYKSESCSAKKSSFHFRNQNVHKDLPLTTPCMSLFSQMLVWLAFEKETQHCSKRAERLP